MQMKELIDAHQAQMLMIAVSIAAPVIGLVWGAVVRRLAAGFLVGLAVGIGNFILWTVYNAITNSLGLDTVKNLLVNLALFIVLGVVIGGVIGMRGRRNAEGGTGVPAAVGGGPAGRAPGAKRSREDAEQPPRDP